MTLNCDLHFGRQGHMLAGRISPARFTCTTYLASTVLIWSATPADGIVSLIQSTKVPANSFHASFTHSEILAACLSLRGAPSYRGVHRGIMDRFEANRRPITCTRRPWIVPSVQALSTKLLRDTIARKS